MCTELHAVENLEPIQPVSHFASGRCVMIWLPTVSQFLSIKFKVSSFNLTVYEIYFQKVQVEGTWSTPPLSATRM